MSQDAPDVFLFGAPPTSGSRRRSARRWTATVVFDHLRPLHLGLGPLLFDVRSRGLDWG